MIKNAIFQPEQEGDLMGSDITNRVQVNDHGSANSKPLKRVPETDDRLDNGSHSLTAPSTAQLL